MQFKFSSLLRSSLLLSTGFSLGLATLISVAEARIASNGILLNNAALKIKRDASAVSFGPVPTNGILLNSTNLKFDDDSMSQLQLEGSQLILHLNR
ncbi:MAG: hypothetical protein Kow00121_12720 [Elainellaceae cyanobacterium]